MGKRQKLIASCPEPMVWCQFGIATDRQQLPRGSKRRGAVPDIYESHILYITDGVLP